MPVIGVRRTLDPQVRGAGGVRTLPNGQQVWELTIRSPQAAALRVHFHDFNAGAGSVWIYDSSATAASPRRSLGPWSGRGIFGSGEFWTGSIFSDSVTIEYAAAAGAPVSAVAPFTVDAVAHFWTKITDISTVSSRPHLMQADGSDPSASCELDVSCHSSYSTAARATVSYDFEYQLGSFAVCSGTIVGTRSGSFLPYMLTANHCINTDPQAQTVEALFFYKTANCGDTQPDLNALQLGFGANYVTGNAIGGGDYALVTLVDPVPAGVTFAGWTATEPAVGDSTVGIHYPMGSWAKITFGHRIPDATEVIDGDTALASDFFQIRSDKGVIEPGSSGSPLLNSKQQIVGTVTGSKFPPGSASVCSITQTVTYGRFSVAYPALKQYLEDTKAGSLSVSTGALSFTSDNGQVVGSGLQTFTVSTTSATPVNFWVVNNESWALVFPTSGQVSAGAPQDITVLVDPSSFTSRGTQGTQIMVSGQAMKPLTVSLSVNVKFHSIVAPVVSPDPVYQSAPDASGNTWFYKITLNETGGAATHITNFSIGGTDYSSRIQALFGSADLPASGTLTATMAEKGVTVPATRQFTLGGADAVTGLAWTQSTTGTFLPAAVAPKSGFAHLAAGSGWQTTLILNNPGASAVPFTLTFHADGGGPVTIDNVGNMSQIADSLAPWASRFYTISSMYGGAGWADISAPADISGVAIFGLTTQFGTYYEGSVPLGATGHGFSMAFDSSRQTVGIPPFTTVESLLTGIGISNADPANSAVITCQVWDFTGHQLAQGLQIPAIAPFGHTSFILQSTAPFRSAVANTRGLLTCSSTTSISAIGIRALGETVSSLPVTTTP